ncbi:MAG: nucleoside-diphosphate sugar epimerase/dehydratase, partial [Phycisphaerales bacterium]
GTVPHDGAERLRRTLAGLVGRRVLLYGVGRHTTELMPVVEATEADVIGFVDDDAGRFGGAFEHKPVVAPTEAASTGASDVVISSWLHEEDMWRRREVFERAGLRVHRLYAD